MPAALITPLPSGQVWLRLIEIELGWRAGQAAPALVVLRFACGAPDDPAGRSPALARFAVTRCGGETTVRASDAPLRQRASYTRLAADWAPLLGLLEQRGTALARLPLPALAGAEDGPRLTTLYIAAAGAGLYAGAVIKLCRRGRPEEAGVMWRPDGTRAYWNLTASEPQRRDFSTRGGWARAHLRWAERYDQGDLAPLAAAIAPAIAVGCAGLESLAPLTGAIPALRP